MQASQLSGNGAALNSKKRQLLTQSGHTSRSKLSKIEKPVKDAAWTNHFDVESGLCYRETVVQVPTVNNSVKAWLLQKNIDLKPTSIVSSPRGTGARSLRKTCLYAIAQCSDMWEAGALEGLDWHFGKDIWGFLYHRRHVNVKVWQMFATAYHAEENLPASLMNCEFTRQLYMSSLIDTIPYLSPPNCQWLTILSLYETSLSRASWMQLPGLTNLSVLLVCDQPTTIQSTVVDGGLTPSIVRHWGRMAREEGAFSKLRLLMLIDLFGDPISYLDSVAMIPSIKILHLDLATTRSRPEQESISRQRWLRRSELIDNLDRLFRSTPTPLLRSRLFQYYNVIQEQLTMEQSPLENSRPFPLAPVLNVRSNSDRRLRRDEQIRLHRVWYELTEPIPSIVEQMYSTPALTARSPAQYRRNVRAGKHQNLGDLLSQFD